VVDYVGITRHLKDALAIYADADDCADEPMIDVSIDIDRLNSAYNEIFSFIAQNINYDPFTQTPSVIEELVATEGLRDIFNELFKKLSIYYDRVLPNPVALNYRDDYNLLAFIRENVANRTRDQRYSMMDASAKVRAIIEEYLCVRGVGVKIPPIDILSPDFIADVEKPEKSDRAIVDEIKYAVIEYINKNKSKDPELFERFSERLDKILEKFNGKWKSLRAALTEFVKNDLYNARQNEETYGYEASREMPFFSLLRKEVFGDKTFGDLSKEEFDALKIFTDYCLYLLKKETAKCDFWQRLPQVSEMRTNIRLKLFDLETIVPSIEEKLNDIVQKIIELGKIHFNE